MQRETTIRCHFTLLILVKFMILSSGKDVDKKELFCIAFGGVNWYKHSGKQLGSVWKG